MHLLRCQNKLYPCGREAHGPNGIPVLESNPGGKLGGRALFLPSHRMLWREYDALHRVQADDGRRRYHTGRCIPGVLSLLEVVLSKGGWFWVFVFLALFVVGKVGCGATCQRT